MPTFLLTFYYQLIFLADQRHTGKAALTGKLVTLLKVLIKLAPVAYLLKSINVWFVNNSEFVEGFLVIVVFNAYYGIRKHRKMGDHDWQTFFIKTYKMLSAVIVTYIVLSIIGKFAGDNLISNSFQVLIQVATLIFPATKALKSIHFLNDGEYPPQWVMERFYGFEKYGNIKKLFNTNDQTAENENIA